MQIKLTKCYNDEKTQEFSLLDVPKEHHFQKSKHSKVVLIAQPQSRLCWKAHKNNETSSISFGLVVILPFFSFVRYSFIIDNLASAAMFLFRSIAAIYSQSDRS